MGKAGCPFAVRDQRRTQRLEAAQGISQRMLTVTLRSLEQDGYVTRTVYAEVPPRVAYQLTPLGLSLLEQVLGLAQWAQTHMGEIVASRNGSLAGR